MTRPRYLFVVSRQHEELFALLVERFQDDKNVEVVLDRRVASRDFEFERRRRRPERDDLSRRSHLIITRED